MYVLKNRTPVALSTSIRQLNCGQLQCIMVVNRPIAVHYECLKCFFLDKIHPIGVQLLLISFGHVDTATP